MSRAGRNNDVRGPSSALTSFLREHGITARHTFGFRREAAAENAAGPSNSQTEPPNETDDMEVTNTPRRNNSGYASDNLDDSEDQADSPPKKKRKLTKAAAAKLKEKEAAAQKKKVKPHSSDEEDDEEDPYKAPSKGILNGITGDTPPIGTFQNCSECGKKFTVSKYTVAADPGPGFLCHTCAKSSGVDPFRKKPSEPRKRRTATEKRVVKNFEEVEPVRSLTSMCIEKIGGSIDRIDELGDIGAANMDQICKIISKNRSITDKNVRLLYDVTNTSLSIYDSTNLKNSEYSTMSSLNPNLERLTLHLCGQMQSTTLEEWSHSFKNLARLELLAPFLVREDGWITFLKAKGPQLKGFLITNAPRFTSKCLDVLVASATHLKELRLSELSKVDDTWVETIAQLKDLNSLELTYPLPPAVSLSSEAVVTLLRAIGPRLARLDLSGNEALDDIALKDGIAGNLRSLEHLSLSLLPPLTDEGVAAFFDALPKTNHLVNLDLSRCHNLGTLSLVALLKHSGLTLVNLNINGWKETDDEVLSQITEHAPRLVELDVGWCRNVNDLVMGSLMKPKSGKSELKTISCFGCNRITHNCPKKIGINIIGVETDVRR